MFVVRCCSQTAVAKLNVVKIPTKQNEAKHHDLELSRGEEDNQHWPCIGQTRSWEAGLVMGRDDSDNDDGRDSLPHKKKHL